MQRFITTVIFQEVVKMPVGKTQETVYNLFDLQTPRESRHPQSDTHCKGVI